MAALRKVCEQVCQSGRVAAAAAAAAEVPSAAAGLLPDSPITAPSAWSGSELLADEGSWRVYLGPAELQELGVAAVTIAARQLRPPALALEELALGPCCAEIAARVRDGLNRGRGFALLHGFPVGGDPDDVAALFSRFCCEVGVAVTQNSQAGLVHFVTDGKRRPQMGNRDVGNPKSEVRLHVDLSDCVSLLCVQQATDSPASRVASTPNMYNQCLHERPGLLPRLRRGYRWTRNAEATPDDMGDPSPYFVPVFGLQDTGGDADISPVATRYNPSWIGKGSDPANAVAPPCDGGHWAPPSEADFGAGDADAFAFLTQTLNEHRLEFQFGRGDVQFCNNHVCTHGREPHLPVEDEELKRLLVRVWMDLPGAARLAEEPIQRFGTIRHGEPLTLLLPNNTVCFIILLRFHLPLPAACRKLGLHSC